MRTSDTLIVYYVDMSLCQLTRRVVMTRVSLCEQRNMGKVTR